MVTVSVGNILFVTIRGLYMGQTTLTTLCYIVDSVGGTEQPYVNVVDAFHNQHIDALGGLSQAIAECYSTGMTDIEYDYQLVYPIRFIKLTKVSASFQSGTVAGANLPPNVAGVVTLRGDVGNRHNIGNKHLGAVPASFSADGRVTPTGRAAYEAYGEKAIATSGVIDVDGITYTLNPVIYNRTTPVNSPAVTNYTVGTTTRVERRRTVGRGI